MANLVDARDSYTGEHSKNVYKYVTLLCNSLNINRKEKEEIELAAKFHDIGKIGISDSILNKPGRLTDEEYNEMKKHPVIGSEVISKIDGFETVSSIIRHHHERWDGNGYPDRLSSSKIPFGAQIIAIADTYDAITSNRVYRKSLGKARAMQILMEERNKQFNGSLVDIFVGQIDNL